MNDTTEHAPDRHILVDRLKRSIDDLAYPYRHTEVIEATDRGGKPYRHDTRHPALITQLARAVSTSSGETGEALAGFRGIYTSEPTARLDAIEAHQRITREARQWLCDMGITPREATVDNLRALIGGAGQLDGDALADLTRAARGWWCWARVVTGWDSMPWRPHGPCPACERIGSLRVREAARTAMCVECGAWWDSSGIHALGDFIRLWHESRKPCDVTPVRPRRDRPSVVALGEVSQQDDTRTRPPWRVLLRIRG